MDELSSFQEQMHKALVIFFHEKRKELACINTSLLPIFDHGAAFTLRKDSKRIRPFLFVVGNRLFGGRTSAEVIRLSVVFELIQSHLLIHDDIMDRDTMRRDGPTVHIALQRESPSKADAEHYGISQAIALGSLFGIWAREIVQRSAIIPVIKIALLAHIESMLATTHYGQIVDVYVGESKTAKRKDIMTVNRLKTARYTIIAPLQCGAILAGAGTKDLAALERYGMPVGIAFQIVNDIKGFYQFGDHHDSTGTSDLAEGKKTLLFDYALRRLHTTDSKKLAQLLRSRPTAAKDAHAVLSLVKKSGAVHACHALAIRLVRKGKKALTGHPEFGIKEVRLLEELADYIVSQVSS